MDALNKLATVEEVVKLMHSFINELVWKKPPDYEPYRGILTSKEWSLLKIEFRNLKEACQADVFSKPCVTQYLSELSDAKRPSKDIQTAIVDCFDTRSEELRTYLLAETDSITGVGQVLRDVDWSVSLVLASDTMGSMRQPLMKLSLHMEGDEGRTTQHLELSQDELKMLINSMETAYKSSLQML